MKPRERSQYFDQMVAAKIKEVRKELGLTQKDFAKHMAVAFQQFQKYEHGTNRITVGALLALAEALEIDVGRFMGADVNQAIWNAGYVQGCQDCMDACKIKQQMVENK